MQAPNEDQASRARLTRLAGKPGKGGLEAGGPPQPDLSNDRIKTSLEQLRRVLAKEVVENEATSLGQDEADLMIEKAGSALEKLATEGGAAPLSPAEDNGLEAVISADGSRPSLLVQDGFVDTADERVGDWHDELTMNEAAIRRAIASSGRLLVNGDTAENSVFGTAWMITPGLAATAQHVVNGLFKRSGEQWFIQAGRTITLDFHVEAGRDPRPGERIGVKGVHWPSPDASKIKTDIDLKNLDIAILELDDEGPEAPPVLQVSTKLDQQTTTPQIHLVGHPARPWWQVPDTPDVAPEEAQSMTKQVLDLVFGNGFGVKRWSPGVVLATPGVLDGDIHRRVMTHDSSTLGGNSGSAVFDLVNIVDRVLGVHYAGHFKAQNYAHPFEKLVQPSFPIPPGAVFV